MTDTIDTTTLLDGRGYGPAEFRRSTAELEVRPSQRIIELVAAPYDVPAPIEWPPGSGRVVVEEIAPTTFRGVETRPNRVKANREHDIHKTFG